MIINRIILRAGGNVSMFSSEYDSKAGMIMRQSGWSRLCRRRCRSSPTVSLSVRLLSSSGWRGHPRLIGQRVSHYAAVVWLDNVFLLGAAPADWRISSLLVTGRESVTSACLDTRLARPGRSARPRNASCRPCGQEYQPWPDQTFPLFPRPTLHIPRRPRPPSSPAGTEVLLSRMAIL